MKKAIYEVAEQYEKGLKPQHTPTPWTYAGIDSEPLITEPQTGKRICFIARHNSGTTLQERIANAAFIVRAVNAHEILLQALKDIANDKEFSQDIHGNFVRKTWYIEHAKRAIAKAEGR